MSSAFGIFFYGVLFLILVGVLVWRYWQGRVFSRERNDAGLLLLPTLTGRGSLQVLAQSSLLGMPYRLILVSPRQNRDGDMSNTLIPGLPRRGADLPDGSALYGGQEIMVMMIDIPSAQTHIISLAQSPSNSYWAVEISKRAMNQVSLEGNFNEYFKIYVDQDAQIDVRQILTPDIMADLIDFGKEYNWELGHGSLTISQPNIANSNRDKTGMTTDASRFVEKILPSLLRIQSFGNHSKQNNKARLPVKR